MLPPRVWRLEASMWDFYFTCRPACQIRPTEPNQLIRMKRSCQSSKMAISRCAKRINDSTMWYSTKPDTLGSISCKFRWCKWCIECFFTVLNAAVKLLMFESEMLTSFGLGGGAICCQHFDRLIRYYRASDCTRNVFMFSRCKWCLQRFSTVSNSAVKILMSDMLSCVWVGVGGSVLFDSWMTYSEANANNSNNDISLGILIYRMAQGPQFYPVMPSEIWLLAYSSRRIFLKQRLL